jgi:flagellar assembly protein FliH
MTRSPEPVRPVTAWQPPDLRTVSATAPRATGPTVEEAAYQRGWEEGREALLADDEASLASRIGALDAIQRALGEAATLLQARFTESVHALAIGIAHHVVGAEFAADPQLVATLVARALTLAPLGGPVTVRLHPEDLEAIRDLPIIRDASPAPVDLRWVADSSIVRGGCVLEGPTSVVDGRIDRIMLDIYERLSND